MTRVTKTTTWCALLGALLLSMSPAHAALPNWCDITITETGGDRTTAIQNALDQGPGSPNNLHWVCLTNGTFEIEGELRFNKNYTALRGDTSTILKITQALPSDDGLNIANRTKIKLQYLTIDSNQQKRRWTVLAFNSDDVEITDVDILNLKNTHGIGINQSDNVRVNNGMIQQLGGSSNDVQDAIWTCASDTVTVRGVSVLGAADGHGGDGSITCYDTENYYVRNVTSVDPGASGIYLVNCSDFEVKNNTVDGSSEWGIDIVGGSHMGVVENNTIRNVNYGAMIFSNVKNNVLDCLEEEERPQGTTSNILVQNNQMSNNSGVGATCPSINVRTNTSNIDVDNNGNTTNQPDPWCWR